MIHRAPFGSIERFTAVLLEHTAGHLPLWLAPDQVKILPVSEKYADYAKKVCDLMKKSDIRASIDDRNETLGKRIREISLLRVPVLVIVGEKEMAENTVSVRHEGVDKGSMSVEDTEQSPFRLIINKLTVRRIILSQRLLNRTSVAPSHQAAGRQEHLDRQVQDQQEQEWLHQDIKMKMS